jgi:hypothetical protein
LTVFTHPHKTGVPVDKEVIIASETGSIPITVTTISMASQVVPAHSIGVGGYLVFDVFGTRTGSASNILLLFSLSGQGFYADTLVVGQNSIQTRFILYADNSTAVLKTASSQTNVRSPYYRGVLAEQTIIGVDTTVDNDFDIGGVIFEAPDTFTLEGYSIRTFNPSTSKNIISGKA